MFFLTPLFIIKIDLRMPLYLIYYICRAIEFLRVLFQFISFKVPTLKYFQCEQIMYVRPFYSWIIFILKKNNNEIKCYCIFICCKFSEFIISTNRLTNMKYAKPIGLLRTQ